MHIGSQNLAALFVFVALFSAAQAQQMAPPAAGTSVYQTTERRPVATLREEEQEQTVMVRKTRTVQQQMPRVVWTPVTQQHYEAVRTNPWNVFAQPQYQWRVVTTSAWQARQETVSVPVTYQELVPEKKTVMVSRRVLGFEDDVQVTRVVTSGPPTGMVGPQPMLANAPAFVPSTPAPWGGAAAAVARQPQYGGITRLDANWPRQGPGVARY